MAKQLVGTKYADMSEDYQTNVSKKEYRQRKRSQRMAGEAIKGGQTREEYQQGVYDVDSLDQFDARAGGRGGAAGGKNTADGNVGRGANRFSKKDAKSLFKQGFSAEELQEYASGQEGKDGFIFGDKAQAFLQKKIAKVQSDDPNEPGDTAPTPTPTPTPQPTPTPSPNPTPDPSPNPNVPPDGGNPYNPGNPVVDDSPASKRALERSTDYDSPADTAEFVARHSAINDMVQNKTPNYAQASIDAARSNKVVDTVALDKRISQRPLYMNAQSTMMGLNLFGDTFKFQAPDWESGLGTGDPADKPDLEGIADDIKDDIDDI